MAQFDRHAVKAWRRRVWRELRRLGFEDGADAIVGLVVIAVMGFGTGADVLSEITGADPATVRDVLRRMRNARILRGQTLSISWTQKGFKGDVALVLDIMATIGQIRRVASPARAVAQRKRTTRVTGQPRRPRTVVAEAAVFTPRIRKADAWYQSREDR